jgi:hypothetical protein
MFRQELTLVGSISHLGARLELASAGRPIRPELVNLRVVRFETRKHAPQPK